MHDDHHHHDHAAQDGGHGHRHRESPTGPGRGHNRPAASPQWQVPHRPRSETGTPPAECDLDLVEACFVEGFGRASDPTSFLRLAGVPFVGVDRDGLRLHLLRVETESLADLGTIAPLLGGEGVRYDPLPARMVSRRQRLAFVYHDGRELRRLDFAAARALSDETAPAHFKMAALPNS